MRLSICGVYPANWKRISELVRIEALWRCVRCHHPFRGMDATEARPLGAPLLCDDYCDTTRGIHLRRPIHPLIERADDPWLKVLNYGVHHLDGDKSNCRWWNLLALCNSCHLKIQSKVIPERAWLFEHSDWFKPYAAGFYAFWFVQEQPDRTQCELHLEEYLAIGQPWLYAETPR